MTHQNIGFIGRKRNLDRVNEPCCDLRKFFPASVIFKILHLMPKPAQSSTKQAHGVRGAALTVKQKDVHIFLTQIRKQVAAVVIIVQHAGAAKGMKIGWSEQSRSD